MLEKRPFVRVRVSGSMACFSRPEMKVERVSYEVITPSAARGILDSILWRPEMRWNITQIQVLRPIRFISIRRNEIQSKIAPGTIKKWINDCKTYTPQSAGAGSEDATPRNTLALRDVAYLIEAEPWVFKPNAEDTPTKYMAMFLRRIENGQCFTRPYLGCREFAADFSPPFPDETPITETRELGWMLYDIDFRNSGNRPVFFNARLKKGILSANAEIVLDNETTRNEVQKCSYKR